MGSMMKWFQLKDQNDFVQVLRRVQGGRQSFMTVFGAVGDPFDRWDRPHKRIWLTPFSGIPDGVGKDSPTAISYSGQYHIRPSFNLMPETLSIKEIKEMREQLYSSLPLAPQVEVENELKKRFSNDLVDFIKGYSEPTVAHVYAYIEPAQAYKCIIHVPGSPCSTQRYVYIDRDVMMRVFPCELQIFWYNNMMIHYCLQVNGEDWQQIMTGDSHAFEKSYPFYFTAAGMSTEEQNKCHAKYEQYHRNENQESDVEKQEEEQLDLNQLGYLLLGEMLHAQTRRPTLDPKPQTFEVDVDIPHYIPIQYRAVKDIHPVPIPIVTWPRDKAMFT
jgi:hypothetical protein